MKLEWSQKALNGKTAHFLLLNGVQAGFVFHDRKYPMWRWHSHLDFSKGFDSSEFVAIEELEHRVRHRVKSMLECLGKYGIKQEVSGMTL